MDDATDPIVDTAAVTKVDPLWAMCIKNAACVSLFLLLASCKQGEGEGELYEVMEAGTQEYLNQASLCSMYFAYSGNKKASQMAFMNVFWGVSVNESLDILTIEELEEISTREVDRVKELFGEAEVSKREASYYLISENECLVHATMGGIWRIVNENE